MKINNNKGKDQSQLLNTLHNEFEDSIPKV